MEHGTQQSNTSQGNICLHGKLKQRQHDLAKNESLDCKLLMSSADPGTGRHALAIVNPLLRICFSTDLTKAMGEKECA